MARKRTPETSTLTRARTVAYVRAQQESPQDHGGEPHLKDTGGVSKDSKDTAKAEKKADAKVDKHDAPPAEKPADEGRARFDTASMPVVAPVGAPPEMPVAAPAPAPPPAVAVAAVEDPTFMPGPRQVPAGNPDDRAAPPGRVPPGDSRSLRRGDQFALVYRRDNAVISRFGTLGTRGQWRVVEYPTIASASHSYAKECSRFVAEGFSDYRD